MRESRTEPLGFLAEDKETVVMEREVLDRDRNTMLRTPSVPTVMVDIRPLARDAENVDGHTV